MTHPPQSAAACGIAIGSRSLWVTVCLALAVAGCPDGGEAPSEASGEGAVDEAPRFAVTVTREGDRLTIAGQLPRGVPADLHDELGARDGTRLTVKIDAEGALAPEAMGLRSAVLELLPILVDGEAEVSLERVRLRGFVRSEDEVERLTSLFAGAAQAAGLSADVELAPDNLAAGQGRLVDPHGQPVREYTLTPLGGGESVTTDARGRVEAGLYTVEDGLLLAISAGRSTWLRADAPTIRVAGLELPLDDAITVVGLSAPDALSFAAAVERDGRRARKPPFGPRARSWTEPWRAEDVLTHRDLVTQCVLHADQTRDSAAAFRTGYGRGISEHFFIDFDGTLFQALDVAIAARHVGDLDPGSIAITLNNLMPNLVREPDALPYPAEGVRLEEFAAHPRPRSERTRINGGHLQSYGYTDAQYRTVGALVRALAGVFPACWEGPPRNVRREVLMQAVPDPAAARGVVGHWHLDEARWDPGPGLDWERLGESMQRGPLRSMGLGRGGAER